MSATKRTLPKGWRWTKLGDVAEYINGRAFKPKDWKTSGTPIIRIQNLNSENAAFNYFDGDVEERYIVENGDLLISWSASLDAFIWQRGTAILNQHIFKANENKEIIRRDYFFYAVKEAMVEIRSQVHGATMKHITRPEFLAITIPLPPLEEQKRIAARLEGQMRHIEQARQAAEESLFAAWELPSAYLRNMFERQTAKKYSHKQLVELCEVRLGKMLSPVSKTGTRSRPYLRNLNVQWGHFDLSDVAEMDFKEQEEERYALHSGDLLVCEGGEPGRAAVWNGEIQPCYYQKALHRLRPINSSVDTYYVMYRLWLGAIKKEFIDSNAHTTIAHLPKIRLEKLSIPVPPLAEQKRMVSLLKEYMENSNYVIAKIESQLAEINELPSALLRQAFAGELSA